MPRLTGIRAKMGVLIAALVLVIGMAILQAISILASVETRLAELDERTSAAFASNALIANADEELAGIVAGVRLATDADALAAIGRESAAVFQQTAAALALLPIGRGGELRLTSQFDLFAGRMDRLIEARGDAMIAQRDLEEAIGGLSTLVDRLDAEVSALMARRLDVTEPGLSRDEVTLRSAARLRLSGQIELFRSRAGDLDTSIRQGRPELVGELRARLGDLVREVAALGRDEDVGDTARLMASIQDMLAPDGDVMLASAARDAAAAGFAAASSDVDEARRAVDRLTAEAAEEVGVSIRNQRRDVFAEVGARGRDRAALLAAVLIALLLLVWWVTDCLVVRRIERLTAEMQRVADGDLTEEVRLEGGDEIGRMARALAVFRTNAIELRRSNDELGNFAYAASHDLRSPLRAIRNLVDWTIEDAGDDLPDEVHANLDMIRARADRLSRLLSDLLEYARAGKGALKLEVVHLPGLIRDIADLADPDRRSDIHFEGDRCIASAKTPLRTMLLNLVTNAIKHHDRPRGVVRIVHAKNGSEAVITVTDDGPGVPEPYQKKVFELFQTLRPSDEIEGSGMGLAMVRKLAGELGGSIELRSPVSDGRGTAFIITLPVRDIVGDEPSVEADEKREGGQAA